MVSAATAMIGPKAQPTNDKALVPPWEAAFICTEKFSMKYREPAPMVTKRPTTTMAWFIAKAKNRTPIIKTKTSMSKIGFKP